MAKLVENKRVSEYVIEDDGGRNVLSIEVDEDGYITFSDEFIKPDYVDLLVAALQAVARQIKSE